MKAKTFRFILRLVSILVLSGVYFSGHSQRINPATRIQKAPAPGYILLSDDSSEYRHTLLPGFDSLAVVTIDSFLYSNDTLYLSLEGDGEPAKFVVIAGGTNTDEQVIDTLALIGDTLQISLSGDNEPARLLGLSQFLDNTDAQTLSYNPVTDEITITGGNTIDISELDTDNQTVDSFYLDTLTLVLALEDDDEAPYTVDLSGLQDGTGSDDQQLTLISGILSIEDGNSVDINVIDTDTDEQTLSLLGTDLSISNGNTVDLGALTGGTDDQTVDTFSLSGTILTLALEDDNESPYTVDLSSLPSSGGTDDQQVDSFLLQGNTLILALEDDGQAPHTVDLSGLGGGTPDGNGIFDAANDGNFVPGDFDAEVDTTLTFGDSGQQFIRLAGRY